MESQIPVAAARLNGFADRARRAGEVSTAARVGTGSHTPRTR